MSNQKEEHLMLLKRVLGSEERAEHAHQVVVEDLCEDGADIITILNQIERDPVWSNRWNFYKEEYSAVLEKLEALVGDEADRLIKARLN